MCGIFVSISRDADEPIDESLVALLAQRGPDSLERHTTSIKVDPQTVTTWEPKPQNVYLTFVSTVLSLRGDTVTRQPLRDESSGSILCWNGEAWRMSLVDIAANDTKTVFLEFLKSSDPVSPHQHGVDGCHTELGDGCASETLSRVLCTLDSIKGPYAFVFLDRWHRRLFFGRDTLGRRSLVYRITRNGSITLASVSDGDLSKGWKEVDADGIYMVDLARFDCPTGEESIFEGGTCSVSKYPAEGPIGCLNSALPPAQLPSLHIHSEAVLMLEKKLHASMLPRVKNIPLPSIGIPESLQHEIPRMAILFSGGVDCTMLARISHELVTYCQAIDLLNVAFENPRVVNAAKSQRGAGNRPRDGVVLEAQPVAALEEGNEPGFPPRNKPHSDHHNRDRAVFDSCPDRATARKSLRELRKLCPGRTWNLIEGSTVLMGTITGTSTDETRVQINVSYDEALVHRGRVVALMHPHNTEMDLSIAYAFYFAARGVGELFNEETQSFGPYATPARALLSGLGADELFAGYTRHALAFSRNKFSGLLAELQLDVSRLGKRNLGRDDRVTAHWGKEVRHPYLDEDLVRWALECPIWEKCGFGQKQDPGDIEPAKKVLRLLALRLGLSGAASEKKRAVQFGARTAKMEIGKNKGTNLISVAGVALKPTDQLGSTVGYGAGTA